MTPVDRLLKGCRTKGSRTRGPIAEEIERVLEFEWARLRRLVDKSHLAMRQGKPIEAATLIAEAKEVRDDIDELEAL